jgi:hypothetical protein
MSESRPSLGTVDQRLNSDSGFTRAMGIVRVIGSFGPLYGRPILVLGSS